MKNIKLLGHRGYSFKYPENTIEAFKKSFEFGADGIEFDVRTLKDGNIVVIHDDSVKRVTGVDKKLKDLNYNDLEKIKINGKFPIPTLKDVLSILPEDSFNNLEIKEKEAIDKTLSLIENHNKSNMLFSSFDIESLYELRNKNKDIKIGLLLEKEKSLEEIKIIQEEVNLYSINIPVEILNIYSLDKIDQLIKILKNLKLKIVFWTLDDKFQFDSLSKYADYIITNKIELIKDLIKNSE